MFSGVGVIEIKAWHLHIHYSSANYLSSLPDGRSSDGQHCDPWRWWWRSFHICIHVLFSRYELPVKNTCEESAAASNTHLPVSVRLCEEGCACPAGGESKTVCRGMFLNNISVAEYTDYLLQILLTGQQFKMSCFLTRFLRISACPTMS